MNGTHIEDLSGNESTEQLGRFDLKSLPKQPIISILNIPRYTLGIWNNNMKERHIEKGTRYAELTWKFPGGENL